MRIVSLLASATEMVCALGLEDRLVGISHECDFPERILDRPRVSRTRFDASGMDSGEIDRAVRTAMAEHGSVYEVDADLLAELEPDLVLTQAICDVCAVPLGDVSRLVAEAEWEARVIPVDAHSIEEILDNIVTVGEAAGVGSRARDYVGRARDRIAAVERAVRAVERPRVLPLEWLEPPFAPGHWVPEMLERAGAESLLGYPERPSAEISWDEASGLDPDVLLVMPCGYGLEQARSDADRYADRLMAAAPRAIDSGRAFVVDASSYLNRSGPRVIDGLEILAGLFHPDRAPAPPKGTAAVWRPSGTIGRPGPERAARPG